MSGGGQEQHPLWRRRRHVACSTIRISPSRILLSRTTIRTPGRGGCKRRNAQTPTPFRRRGKGHVRKERVRCFQQSADFVGVLCVMFSRRFFVWKSCCLRGRGKKLLSKRSKELRTYKVCMSYSDTSVVHVCISNQLFQKRSERYDDIRESWMKLFHCCIHINKRERERGTHASHEHAHRRATRAAA